MVNEKDPLKLEQEVQRLRQAVDELSVLNDIATAITSTQSVEKIINSIVQKCIKHLRVEQGAVLLLDKQDEDKPFHTMVRRQNTSAEHLPYRLNTQLTGWMIKNNKPLLINDLPNDPRFNWIDEATSNVRSLLCVPMTVKGNMIGLITTFNKHDADGFSNEDLRLLAIIAAQSAQVVENARLYEEEQNLLRFQEEMRLARDIQIRLLPAESPQIKGYELVGRSISAKDVGGDYFDFIKIDDHRIAFCLGDVSGKGIPAALLMSNLQATLRAQTDVDLSPRHCIGKTNRLLHKNTDDRKFATLFYAILDYTNNELHYCNGGHDHPVLIHTDGSIERLETGGIVLGFMDTFEYEDKRQALNTGDVLLVYSDGISEAMNAAEEEFGEERLVQLAVQNRHLSPADLIERILGEVQNYAGDYPQMDDQTLLVLNRGK